MIMDGEIIKQSKMDHPHDVAMKEMIQGINEWELIKTRGSQHYKGGSIEPIDLFKDLQAHETLTVLQVKGLSDIIKYAFRQLKKGANKSDCGKIKHYADMVEFLVPEEE